MDPLNDVNLLDLSPVRVAEWERSGDRIVLLRPAPCPGGLRGFLNRLLYTLSASRIRLDDFGTFAWEQLDGSTTVAKAAQAMRDHFGEKAEPVEERLGHFVRMLRREGMLAFPGWDEPFTAARQR